MSSLLVAAVYRREKRKKQRAEYLDAIQDAHDKIHVLAEGLKNSFGKYNIDHYYKDLIHRAHKSRSTRKVNSWNAYQRLELARIRGLCVMMKDTTIYLPHKLRGTGERHHTHRCEQRNQRELGGIIA